ncbi:MAG: hypothetical protein R3F20_04595 [Planctomycetota bacterium]
MSRPAILSGVLLLALALGACGSLDHFEVEAPVPGFAQVAAAEGPLDLLVLHGMGGFYGDDPAPVLDAFAEATGVLAAGEPEDEHVAEGSHYFGRIRRHEFAGPAGAAAGEPAPIAARAFVVYWTGVTQGPKDLYLDYDRGGAESARREGLNDELKRTFVDKNVPDLALYLGRHRAAIHRGLRRAFERVVEEGAPDRALAIVSYSLGARIVVDLLHDLSTSPLAEDRALASAVFDRLRYFAMLSNQLGMLELVDFDYETSAPDPESDLAIALSPALRTFDAELRRREGASGRGTMPVLAVTDPNDLISFAIPPWMQAAFPGRFVNAWVSVATTSWWIPFVPRFARPDTAHREYSQRPAVQGLLAFGYPRTAESEDD